VETNGKPRTKTHSLVLEVATLLNGSNLKSFGFKLFGQQERGHGAV
jgi:hypothetical protein